MAKYGLIGKNISYSFSKTFFSVKFEQENRQDTYHNFDIESIDEFSKIVSKTDNLRGLNVTIPYKEAIIPLLDRIDNEAAEIGAVNTVKFQNDGSLKAIKYVLDTMDFTYKIVSRTKTENTITYKDLTKDIVANHYLIINCTPLGTSPNVTECPNIPYQYITADHVLFDLIYNPPQTEF